MIDSLHLFFVIKDYSYSQSPLPKLDLEILSKEYASPLTLLLIATRLVKKDFERSYLKVFFWNLLFTTILPIILVSFCVVFIEFSQTLATTYIPASLLILLQLGAYLVTIIFLVITGYYSLRLRISAVHVFHKSSLKSVWASTKPSLAHITKALFYTLLPNICSIVLLMFVLPLYLSIRLILVSEQNIYQGGGLSVVLILTILSCIFYLNAFVEYFVSYSFTNFVLMRESFFESITHSFASFSKYPLQSILRIGCLFFPLYIVLIFVYSNDIDLIFLSILSGKKDFSTLLFPSLFAHSTTTVPPLVIALINFVTVLFGSAMVIVSIMYHCILYYSINISFVNNFLVMKHRSKE